MSANESVCVSSPSALRDSYSDRNTDIAADKLIYTIKTSIMTFKSHPDEPVIIPVVSVFSLVPQGQPDAGKIDSLTLYEDPTPIGMKLQEIMGGPK